MPGERVRGRSRRRAIFVLGLVGAALLWSGAWLADRQDRRIRVELVCAGESCTASIDGAPRFEFESRPMARADRLGFYVYHPHEFDRPQYFRELEILTTLRPALHLSLLDAAQGEDWFAEAGWGGKPGRGLTHAGDPGARSAAILTRFESVDFTLRVELFSSVDAGILFRAEDRETGTVLAVRSRHNDVLVFDLDRGEPGPIVGFAALRELRAGREALRLGGLLAEILLVAAAFLAATRLLILSAPALGRGAVRPAPRRIRRLAGRYWPVVLGLVAFVALAGVATFGLERVPHIADETAYLFQAKILAGGALWAPPPPGGTDFFLHEHILVTPSRWFGKYPPLFPLLLAVGVLAGAPWLVNPVLGALTVVAVYVLGREIAGWKAGIVAALLTLSSPFFLIMGGTMMSHVAAALFVTVFLWLVIRGLRRLRAKEAVLAAACLGLVLLTRPYTALLVGSASAVYAGVCWLRASDRRSVFVWGLVLILGVLPFAGGYLLWNGLFTDSAIVSSGLHTTFDATDRLGFGADKGSNWLRTWGSWGHTPAKALRSAHYYLDYTSLHLLGWPGRLSLALVVGAFLLRRAGRADWLLLGAFAALAAGHMLYWATQHLGYGARYWFAALPGLMVLCAVGLQRLTGSPSGTGSPAEAWRGGRVAAAVVAVLVVWNLTTYIPSRFAELERYGGISADLRDEIEARDLRRAVVFVQTQGLMFNDGFFMNDPFMRADRVFARDLGSRNPQLLDRFPGYRGYRWFNGSLVPLAPPAAETARFDGSDSTRKPAELP